MEDAHLHVPRGVTRWSVCDGAVSFEGVRCVPLAIEAAVLAIALIGSIVAIGLT
jgi:hypothetical protein